MHKIMKLILCLTLINIVCPQSCLPNEVQYGETCWQQCPDNTAVIYRNGVNTCEQCDLTRLLVFDRSTGTCSCARQTYINPVNSQCQPCHFSCLTCNGPNPNDCSTCQSPVANTFRVYNQGQCLCQLGYFSDPVSASLVCSPCHKDCQTCKGLDDLSCETCASGKIKNQDGHCVCSNGFVQNQLGICVCPLPMLVFPDGICKNPINQCGYQEEPSKLNNIAKAAQSSQACDCIAGLVKIKGKCDACRNNETYNSKNRRCECPSNGFKFKQRCIICPVGQNFDVRTGTCNCRKNQSMTQTGACVRCPSKSIYQEGSCVCISNFYMQSNGKCKKCNKKSDNPKCQQNVQGKDRPRKLFLHEL